ncbi:MAG: tRNA 4-thiouridine(8) synthase ThiI [Planctomycetota bacterium]|jgi:hypothetical protein|nr:tRNA 4-thiouridine(8) synthase ThiI [Planctomycetota bacterium]
MTRSCIALLSGGLDSLLAMRLMALQGIRVVALHAENCFHGTERPESARERIGNAAIKLGAAETAFPDLTGETIAIVKKPKYGYGRNLNPCIDCRLLTIRAGFDLMTEKGADFLVSGEVVGQRPMSQRRDAVRLVDRLAAEWGFAGLHLRPLSARLLDMTIPETKNWIDRKLLFGISGRGRRIQMELAERVGLGVYPTPAGGCLLTDACFSGRLADLMRFTPDWGAEEVELLKVGRHYLPGPATRIVASRSEDENRRLGELARPEDFLYINAEKNGAVVLLRGAKTDRFEALSAGLAVFFSKMRERGRACVRRWREGREDEAPEREFAVVDPETLRELEKRVRSSWNAGISSIGGDPVAPPRERS